MLLLRRVGTVLVGTWAGAWIARLVFDWMLGIDGTLLIALSIGATVLGAILAIPAARELEPWPQQAQRDTVVGWGVVLALILAVPCFALPMPFAAIAAGAVVLLGMLALRQWAIATGDQLADADTAER